jgi:predicted RNA-binding Zn-ribbon protein involved in translation (DUF1610 family)
MEKDTKRSPQLNRTQVIKLSRLLYMKYRPSEIADILGVNTDTVYRSYLPAGCPHTRDGKGHYWIVGTEFKAWAENVIAKRKRKKNNPMKQDEGWCVKCNQRVKKGKKLNIKPVNKNLELVQWLCPNCGAIVNRAQKARG